MKDNKGFSLVELIIVIAIMAVLAAAIAPAVIRYIDKSRYSIDVENADEISRCIANELLHDDLEFTADDASFTITVDATGTTVIAHGISNADVYINRVFLGLNIPEDQFSISGGAGDWTCTTTVLRCKCKYSGESFSAAPTDLQKYSVSMDKMGKITKNIEFVH